MNGKKPILYAVKIQVTSYAADTENLEKINEQFYEKSSTSLIEVFVPFTIQAVAAARASCADGYMNEISDFTYRQLSELRKELSNTLPLVTEDKELSLLIFQGAADGLMNFLRGSKQSRMDWFTTPDILPK